MADDNDSGGVPPDGGAPDGGAPDGGAGDGGASAPYRPDGLPESYHGENDQETIDRLYGAVKGFRDEKAKLPPVPKDIGEYAYEPSDALKPYLGGEGSDPLLDSFKAAAFKNKIPASVLGDMIEETFRPLIEGGAFPEPYNPEKETKRIGEYLGLDGKDEIAGAWEDAKGWAKGLAAQMGDKAPEAVKGELNALAETAEGVMLIRHLQGLFAEKGLSVGGQEGGAGGLTKADLKRLDADERIDPNSQKFDPDLRKQYDDAYRRLF